MPFFSEKQRDQYSDHPQEVLMIDRLVDELNKMLIEEKTTDINKIKASFFDIVVLRRLLHRIGIKFELSGTIKEIRDSLAHVDDRIDIFDFKPTIIHGPEWANKEKQDNKFTLSKTYNFQGAISMAVVGTDGIVKAVGPYGMIDDIFIWINRAGKQTHTSVQEIRDAYSKLIETAARNVPRASLKL